MASTSLATLLKLISVLSVLVQLSLALSADSQLSVEDHGQDDKNGAPPSTDTSFLDEGYYIVGKSADQVIAPDGTPVSSPTIQHVLLPESKPQYQHGTYLHDAPKTRSKRFVPLIFKGIAHVFRGGGHAIFRGAPLSQNQAVNVLRGGGNVITNSRHAAEQMAKQAWGKKNFIKHGAHKAKPGHMNHFQHKSSKVPGHVLFDDALFG